jgi:hypothetical protein
MSFGINTRRRNFDITVGANTYAGELKYPILAAATKSNDTVAKGFVTVLEGIHHKAVLPTLAVTDPLAVAACAFTSGNDTTIGEKVLTLKDLMVNEEICRKTVYPTWHGTATARATTNVMTPEFVNFTLAEVAAKTAESIENQLWQGSSVFGVGFLSNDGTFDETGFDASGLAGATEVDIATITNANAIAQFNLVYTKAATDKPGILSKPGLAFYVNKKTYALYCQQLAGLGAGVTSNNLGINNLATAQNFDGIGFMGVPINVCPGMFDDAIVLTYKENLVYGSNVGTDQTDIQWIPTYQYDGSDNIRIVMRFALGVQSRIPADAIVGATWVTA